MSSLMIIMPHWPLCCTPAPHVCLTLYTSGGNCTLSALLCHSSTPASDGKEYGFLAKPKDDLRKDYRLMDFVCVLNDLLGRELASRRRGLALRTYAVIPLAEECGILQWVNGLVAFKGACEEVYGAERLYKRNVTAVQIKKMYDSFGGGWSCCAVLRAELVPCPGVAGAVAWHAPSHGMLSTANQPQPTLPASPSALRHQPRRAAGQGASHAAAPLPPLAAGPLPRPLRLAGSTHCLGAQQCGLGHDGAHAGAGGPARGEPHDQCRHR